MPYRFSDSDDTRAAVADVSLPPLLAPSVELLNPRTEPTIRDVGAAVAVSLFAEATIAKQIQELWATYSALSHTTNDLPAVLFPVALIVIRIVEMVIVYTFVCHKHRQPFQRGFAIYPITGAQALIAGCIGLVLVIPAQLVDHLAPEKGTLSPLADALTSGETAALWLAFAVLVPPLEECFFRGFMFPAIRRKFGAPMAFAVVTVVFAAMHFAQLNWHMPSLGVIMLGSVVLTAQRHLTGSLIPSMITHWVYNIVLVGLSASALLQAGDAASLVVPHSMEPTAEQVKLDLLQYAGGVSNQWSVFEDSDFREFEVEEAVRLERGLRYVIWMHVDSHRGASLEARVQITYRRQNGQYHFHRATLAGNQDNPSRRSRKELSSGH